MTAPTSLRSFRSKLREQPAGIYLLFSTELWERFSYYGMLGLLILYLVAPASAGGFGWSNAQALGIYGVFLSSIWFAPLAGGFVSDRYLGPRRAVVWGCAALSLGNCLLSARAWLPWLVSRCYGIELSSILDTPQAVLAHAWSSAAVIDSLHLTGTSLSVGRLHAVLLSYRLIELALAGALLSLIVGAGLFKSNVSVLMGQLFHNPSDPRRDFGFTIFYMGINVGALLAPLIAGTLGERVAWHWGFLVSAVGMLIGILLFVRFQNRLLGEPAAIAQTRAKLEPVTAMDRRKVLVIGFFALFATVFGTGLMMYGGLLNLFTAQNIDRHAAGFEIPTTWFLTLNPLYIVLFGPAVASFWDSRDRSSRPAGSAEKFAAGLFLMTLAFAIIAYVAVSATPEQPGYWFWIPVFYLLFTLGELCLFPIGLALVSRLAPARWVGVLMGGWLLTYAVGSALAGELGVLAQSIGAASIFAGLAVVALITCVCLIAVRPLVYRFLNQRV